MGLDLSGLEKSLLDNALPGAVQDLEKVTGLVLDWVQLQVAAQPFPVSMLAALIPELKKLVLAAEEKL